MKKCICLLLIICCIVFNGCVEKSAQVYKREKPENSIIYDMGKCPNNLIMTDSYNIRQQDLLANLFEGLVKMDPSGKVLPALAENWSVNKDQTCYTFKIRKDAKWSNGTDITADDFVEFFKDFLKNKDNNLYAEGLYCIFGAEDYENGTKDFSNVAIRAVDKNTLEIKLNYSCSYLLNILSQPIYNLRKMDDKLKNWKSEYKNILYSGYFTIDKFSEDGGVDLIKNKYYWNKNNVKSNGITISFNNVKEASLAAFQSNSINIFTDPPKAEVKSLVSSGSAVQYSGEVGTGLIFNAKKAYIAGDVNLRKAISECIDRDGIVKNELNDSAKTALSYIPDTISDGFNGKYINKNFFTTTSQKDKAVQDLKNSAYQNNKNSLVMIYINTEENRKVCESIVKSLKENLGIVINSKGYEKEEFNDAVQKGDYDIAQIDYSPQYNYPLAFLELWTSSSKFNIFGYKNLQYDTQVLQGRIENDRNKQINFFRSAENILIQDVILIPLYFNNTVVCEKQKICGLYTNDRGNIILDKVYEKK